MKSNQSVNDKFKLFNRYEWIAICFVVIQQIIVASSTIWITRLITHLQASTFPIIFLILYLLSLILPYIPGAISLVFHSKAKVVGASNFLKIFTSRYQGKIFEWTNDSQKTTKSSVLSGETTQTLSYSLDYFYHLATSGLNVFLNLVIISIIIEPLLLATYAIGILFCYFILISQKKFKKILTLRAQQSRIKWVSMLLKAWDNILLSNSYNIGLWKNKTNKRSNRLIASAVKLESYSQLISVLMAISLLAPSFIAIVIFGIMRSTDFIWLATMVVTLPRLFQVLSYSYEMLFLLSDYPVQKSRIKTVLGILEPSEGILHSEQLQARIQWDRLSLKTEAKNSIDPKSLLDQLPAVGRFQIRGENGCGKTSLLLLLKSYHNESAYYLPTRHELIFKRIQDKLSTGQKVKTVLNELLENVNTQLFLLDEWDANLDLKNKESFDELIDQLSKRACVVESRHSAIPSNG